MAVERFADEKGLGFSPALTRFVDAMSAMVRACQVESEQVERTLPLLRELVRDASWLRPEWTVPSAEQYARYPVYQDPEGRFEVLVLVWLPGQGTLLHDHDGTWGAEGVVRGTVTITNYRQEGEAGPDLVRLTELGTEEIRAGETGQLLPPADCHIVANRGQETAITVHVYGKPLRQFRVFEPTEEPGLYRAQWVQVRATRPVAV